MDSEGFRSDGSPSKVKLSSRDNISIVDNTDIPVGMIGFSKDPSSSFWEPV
jgi:hypothetical protein